VIPINGGQQAVRGSFLPLTSYGVSKTITQTGVPGNSRAMPIQ
jgi:hypothetical protein